MEKVTKYLMIPFKVNKDFIYLIKEFTINK